MTMTVTVTVTVRVMRRYQRIDEQHQHEACGGEDADLLRRDAGVSGMIVHAVYSSGEGVSIVE